MNENNKRYQQGIVMGILICILIGLSAFVIYDKVLSDKNNDNNSNDVNEENSYKIVELKLTDTLVNALYDYVDSTIDTYNDGKFNRPTELFYPGYFYSKNSVDLTTSESYNFKLYLASYYMDITSHTWDSPEGHTYDGYKISRSNVKDTYESIWGVGTYQETKEFVANSGTYKYNEKSDIFEGYSSVGDYASCGDPTDYNRLISAKNIVNEDSDIIELTEVVAFEKGSKDDCEHMLSYKDYNHTQYVEDSNYPVLSRDEDLPKYNKYKYTYEKNSYGQYILTKGEWVK